jgi:hypothetical protein
MSQDPERDTPKMTPMADHRKTAPGRSSAKVPAWAVLITMGGTSITLNFWDATHAASPMFWLIAGLRGFAPVLAAMFISEAGARFDGGKTFRGVTFAIMGGAMLLSASAVANVLRPSYPAGWLGLGMSWLFGIVLDAAALAGLWMILTERERRREAERQGEADDAAQAMAEAVAAAEARAGEQAQAERVQIEAEAAEERSALEAELARVGTELTVANATVDALKGRRVQGRKSRRSSPRKPATTSPQNNGTGSPLNMDDGSPPELEDASDFDTEAQAVQILGAEPTISGSELGLRLGKTKRYGCILKNKLAASVPGPEDA